MIEWGCGPPASLTKCPVRLHFHPRRGTIAFMMFSKVAAHPQLPGQGRMSTQEGGSGCDPQVPHTPAPHCFNNQFHQNLSVPAGGCCLHGACSVPSWLPEQEWLVHRGSCLHSSHLQGPQQLVSQNATAQVPLPQQPADGLGAASVCLSQSPGHCATPPAPQQVASTSTSPYKGVNKGR